VSGPFHFGPRPASPGGFEFSLWAPAAKRVDLVGAATVAMNRQEAGWFRAAVPEAGPGYRYRFRIDGEVEVPDPASAFQPEDVFGPSEVIARDYAWQASEWRGRPWHEAAILELHVGTFTEAGTFRAAIERLDEVAAAGFTAIELMPVADFFGRWNWGYDGVLWYAPDSAYGRPEDLKALVDAAHRRGLMVFLDVVYNHFGPEGNFLTRYAPSFFAPDSETPWGAAIDYRVPEVRAFAVGNALHWLSDYRFDGLRLDAVHAIAVPGEPSILEEISAAAGRLAGATGRHIHLVLENDDNAADLLDPRADPPAGKYRAQWNDDYHHAWHVLLTGEHGGYYRDYAGDPLGHLVRILKSGFAYQGELSGHREGRRRGAASGHLPPTAFVSLLQNHDQIGNRPRGERLEALAPARQVEAALAVTLLAPMPPLMFMGEPWGETRPFQFFCDFQGDLARAVREGRAREFRDAYAGQGAGLPDPIAEATFRQCKIDWDGRNAQPHRRRYELVRQLLACRARHVAPRLVRLADVDADARADGRLVEASWRLDGGRLHLRANLGDAPRTLAPLPGSAIWGGPQQPELSPWSVVWTWED